MGSMLELPSVREGQPDGDCASLRGVSGGMASLMRSWWVLTLAGLMVVVLALGAALNFTSAFLAIPILALILVAGIALRIFGAASSDYSSPDEPTGRPTGGHTREIRSNEPG